MEVIEAKTPETEEENRLTLLRTMVSQAAISANIMPPLEECELTAISGLLLGTSPIDQDDWRLREGIVFAKTAVNPRALALYGVWRTIKPAEKIL
jgi:hypothetical protein